MLPAARERRQRTELGGMVGVLDDANREDLAELYRTLGLSHLGRLAWVSRLGTHMVRERGRQSGRLPPK